MLRRRDRKKLVRCCFWLSVCLLAAKFTRLLDVQGLHEIARCCGVVEGHTLDCKTLDRLLDPRHDRHTSNQPKPPIYVRVCTLLSVSAQIKCQQQGSYMYFTHPNTRATYSVAAQPVARDIIQHRRLSNICVNDLRSDILFLCPFVYAPNIVSLQRRTRRIYLQIRCALSCRPLGGLLINDPTWFVPSAVVLTPHARGLLVFGVLGAECCQTSTSRGHFSSHATNPHNIATD